MSQVLNQRLIYPYYPPLPPDKFMKWMFFLTDNMGKATTICVHPRFFITFRHGTHLQFKIGDKLAMYSADKEVNEQVGIEVCVVNVNEALDFVLLKSKFNVVERGPSIVEAVDSERYTLAEFANGRGSLSYLPGAIHSCGNHFLRVDEEIMGPFTLGTSKGSTGFSGGAIWGSRGLIGMSCDFTAMEHKFHNLTISETATICSKSIISKATRFKEAYENELVKEDK